MIDLMTTDVQKTCRGCKQLIRKLSDHKDDCPYKEIFPDMFASVEEASMGDQAERPFQLDATVTIPALEVQVFIRTKRYPDASSGDHCETLAYSQDSKKFWGCKRHYENEEEARKGHEKLIEKLTTGTWELEPVQWKIRYVSAESKGAHQEDTAEDRLYD